MIAIQNKWRIPTDLKGSKGQVTTGTPVVLTDLEDGTPCGATVRCTVLPLMDLAARVVGQTYTCRGLEESRFTLDTLLLTKAMEHVGKVKDLYFLQMAFEVFSNMMERFSVAQNERFVDLIMAFLRQYFPISYKRFHNTRDRMFKDLCILCEKTMEYTMRSILRTLEEVCHIFIENQLKGFVRLLESSTSDSKTLMKKVTKELAFYLRRNATFDVTFVDFIFILKKYHTGRHACIDVILEQHEKFSTESLLYLAKREHEIEPMRVTRRQNILSERIFELIRAGMSNLTKNVGKSRMLHDLYFETKFLVFFMDVFARNTEIELTKEEQFTSFLRLLIEKCELDTIVKVFTAQKYSMEMTETVRNKIGEKLSIRISKIFLKCLTICNHIYYSEIVIKILNAKDLFEMFVPNGTERFNDMVNVLKEKLKSKKKLQRILTITFD
ncbi:hypothetical protein FSP39_019202 [Pinctada imbricata]|uniref:Uncharacterized protein n=1 Tax=Pinctada imbricata TaxID=66713 RepID=A0AA89CB20_PINIB|nr:hypothetical protein FSP39_019202 [Pinctada imbricata]